MADHRLRVPASQIGAFALALAAEIGAVTKDARSRQLDGGAANSSAKSRRNGSRNCGRSRGEQGQEPRAGRFAAAGGACRRWCSRSMRRSAISATTIGGRKIAGKPAATIATLAAQARRRRSTTPLHRRRQSGLQRSGRSGFAAKLKNARTMIVRVGFYEDETSEHAQLARAARALSRSLGRRHAHGRQSTSRCSR